MASTISEVALRRVTGTIGAEVAGVDLVEVDDQMAAAIRGALLKHLVLVFRDQNMTLAQHRDLGSKFGPLNIHPNIPADVAVPEAITFSQEPEATSETEVGDYADLNSLRWNESGEWSGGGLQNNVWHSDLSCLERPPMGSILYCRAAPACGGDTLWANQYAAYATLSKRMQSHVDGLAALHTNDANVRIYGGENSISEHPVVRTHPETGRRALFVNPAFTREILEVTSTESAALLTCLYEHSTRPDFCMRLTWEPGTVVFWDNRCTMHYAVEDYRDFRREMQRITIDGDRPY
jgi:taurine dioxygenase